MWEDDDTLRRVEKFDSIALPIAGLFTLFSFGYVIYKIYTP